MKIPCDDTSLKLLKQAIVELAEELDRIDWNPSKNRRIYLTYVSKRIIF